MTRPPRLVVLSEEVDEPRLGPTGHNRAWQGELAVQLHDGSVVKIGATLYDRLLADYSNNSRWWDKVQLQEIAGGWLVKVTSLWFEMGAGEGVSAVQRWRADSNATTWSQVSETEQLTEGAVVDELETPASDRTITEEPP